MLQVISCNDCLQQFFDGDPFYLNLVAYCSTVVVHLRQMFVADLRASVLSYDNLFLLLQSAGRGKSINAIAVNPCRPVLFATGGEEQVGRSKAS